MFAAWLQKFAAFPLAQAAAENSPAGPAGAANHSDDSIWNQRLTLHTRRVHPKRKRSKTSHFQDRTGSLIASTDAHLIVEL